MANHATKLEVWKWLKENGETKRTETIANEMNVSTQSVNAAIRRLSITGHVSMTLDYNYRANSTDELYPQTSVFGAGGGPVEGEEPDDSIAFGVE